jgi:hypothetical protein
MDNGDYSVTRNPVEDALYRPVSAPRRAMTVPSYQPRSSVNVVPSAASPSPAVSASASTPPSTVPNYQSPNDNLSMWGYTGEIPINNLEQQAIDFVNQMYGSGGALETLGPAQDYYNAVLRGDFGPESQAYVSALLDPMRARMTQDYNDASKSMATRFSDVGGYFGGRHGVGQARLASENNMNMANMEAELRYKSFMDDMANRSGAASGLTGLASTQSGLSGDMLNYLLSTGGMVTGRDALNRSEYQNALGRSYQDWVRARQELLMPFSMAGGLYGTNAVENIVTPSPWGALLGGIGQAGGLLAGKAVGI